MSIKKLNIPSLFILLAFICYQSFSKEIMIDYEFNQIQPIEEYYLKYFFDAKDKYFLDAGAFDPTHKSTSVGLIAQGWNGIFVEASPERSRRFMEQRQDHVVFNMALGREN